MKKQFFSKLLMAAMFVTAVGSFQSCKDYDGDIAGIQQNADALQGQVNSLKDALNTAKQDLAAAQAAADQAVKAAQDAANASEASVNAVAEKANVAVEALSKVAALQTTIDELQKSIEGVQAIMDGKVDQKTLDSEIARVAGRIDAIDTKLNTLTEGIATTATLKSAIDDAKKEAIEAVEALKADVESQKATLALFQEEVASKLANVVSFLGEDNQNVLTMLNEKVAKAEASINALQTAIAQINVNSNSISEIKNTLEEMQATINGAVEKCDNVSSTFSTLNVFVDNALTSIVLKPTLYYGGIEAVEAIHGMYQPLGFSIYYQDEYTAVTGHQDGSRIAYDRTSGNAYDITYEYAPKDDLIYKYPIIDAYYHVNPKHISEAEVGELDLNTMDRHYVNTSNTDDNDLLTRAEKQSLDTSLDVYRDAQGKGKIFSVKDGILHAYFTNSADMWHRVEQYANTVTVVSLEATAPANEGTFRTVTSDWAAVARVHQMNYRIADNDAYILHYETYPHIYKPQDTDCGMMDCQQYTWTEQHVSDNEGVRTEKYNKDIVHVYRQAREAILNPYTHLLKWDGEVDLSKCIEVHADHHYYDSNGQTFDFPVDTTKLGFHYKYTVVNYQYPASMGININGTEESQHAHIVGGEWGHILKANFVKNGKRDITTTSRSSIGREPLVMIEVIDTKDKMTWNPDHMNWSKDSVDINPDWNLVAVGFIKFKIVDEDINPYQLINVPIECQNANMYASCAGDTILTNWHEVEEEILNVINKSGVKSISKAEFENNYVLRNINGEEYTFREIALLGDGDYVNGQVYIPYTNKTSIIGSRKNWIETLDQRGFYNNVANWVLPQVVLNGDITNYDEETLPNIEQRFIDPARYGQIVYTNYDYLHRETNLIGVAFTAEQMLQQLVKRDHTGQYLDSLGNKVNYLSEADFYPYVDTWVAAKLVDPNHNGWPEITLVFKVRVNLNKATMLRPSKASGNGNWYAVGGGELKYINANIDAFQNGVNGSSYPYIYDVRRFVMNLQQNLKGQQWLASSSSYTRAFDFFYSEITGTRAAERIGIQRAKLGKLHGDLYFYTDKWLGDLEEGTPYWHDKNNTPTIADDKFYADKYLIKACYTKNPLDTVVWAQEAKPLSHVGKLGKYLFAYKYIEDWDNANKYENVGGYDVDPKLADPINAAGGLVQNYSHYDMNNGELIAWIDNYDTHQVDANPNMVKPYANFDINGDLNNSVNVHYNYNSKFAQDLLNRAGRWAEDQSGTQDGYSKATDNPFTVRVHLNLFEGDCLPAINPRYTETYDNQSYLFKPDNVDNYVIAQTVWHHDGKIHYVTNNQVVISDSYAAESFWHRPEGVPVMLSNPDFLIRFERPISVEFKTPWQTPSINAVDDAIAGAAVATITYTDLFRDQTGTPNSRIFPMDWRNYTQVKNQTTWIQFYQGKQSTGQFNDAVNDGTYDWNRAPWKRTVPYGLGYLNGYKYMDQDRSSYDRGSNAAFFNWNNWFYLPNTDSQYADSWNSMNVVPQVDHMLTNYGGTEGFWLDNASQVNMQISHQIDPNTGNIVSTTFRYLNDNINRGTFDILIPVTVKYAWGDITTTGKWQSTNKIQRTADRYYHNTNMNYIKVHFGATIGN